MKKSVLIFLFSFLFACNTSSIGSAYKDYYKYQQKYISAILDNNKKNQIYMLKEIIQCGKYLHFDVKTYEEKLKKLSNYKLKTKLNFHKKPAIKAHTPSNKIKKYSRYIKIYSFNPLKIKIPDENIKYFTINRKLYKKVIDLPLAIIAKPVFKTLKNNIKLKIAQFNKKTVRIVLYSNRHFSFKYRLKNHILIIYATKSLSLSSIKSSLAQKPKAFKINRKIIVIDPGHGGKDSGGIGLGGKYEKIAVLEIARYVRNYLKQDGYTVYMTRNSDKFIPLRDRTHFANLKKADLFISIHCNIAPHHIKSIHGIQTYYLSPTRDKRALAVARLENKGIKGLNYLDQQVILNFLNRNRIIDSNKFAIDVQQSMLNSLRSRYSHVKDGGVRPAPFWVLVGTQMPAILIETGYLTNPMEVKRLFNPAYQKRLAKGIAEGVVNYFRKNP